MPSHSKKQARFMTAVCKNRKFAKKVGVPQSVGCEFHNADKRKNESTVITFKQYLIAE